MCLYDVERQLCNTINIVLLQNSTAWKITFELEARKNINCITSTVILLHNYSYRLKSNYEFRFGEMVGAKGQHHVVAVSTNMTFYFYFK